MSTATLAEVRRRRVIGAWLDRVTWPQLVIIGLVVLIARRPESLFAAEFTWEEANAFYVPTFFFDPVAQLTQTWGGTLQLVPRLGYLALRAVPVLWAPLAENLLSFIAVLGVAVFVASDRLASAVPDRRVRLALAASVLLLTAQRDVMGALMNVQWYGGLWLAVLPIASTPVTALGRWMERALIALVALTGPFSLLLAPVYLWRLRSRRQPHDIWLAAIVLLGGFVQIFAILATGRAEVAEQRPAELAFVTFWLHATIVPVIGERLGNAVGDSGVPAAILFVGGATLVASLVLTAWRSLPAAALPLVYGGVVIGLSGIAVHAGANVWPPGAYERYFLVAAVLVAVIVVAGVVRRSRLAAALAVLLAIGIVSDFRLEAHPAQGWPEAYRCIGSPEPCVVPIWPSGYDVHWPGGGGRYALPVHFDP